MLYFMSISTTKVVASNTGSPWTFVFPTAYSDDGYITLGLMFSHSTQTYSKDNGSSATKVIIVGNSSNRRTINACYCLTFGY